LGSSHQQRRRQHSRVELDLEMAHGATVHSGKRSTSCLGHTQSRVACTGAKCDPQARRPGIAN